MSVKISNGAAEIAAVEESDAGSDEIECCGTMRLPLVRELRGRPHQDANTKSARECFRMGSDPLTC